MNREQFSNNAQDTLDGGIDASQTSIDLNDASEFPAVGNFRVSVDDEIMLCTARSGNVLTVLRGQENTIGASHSNGALASLTVTAGGITTWALDNDPFWGSTRPPSGTPLASDFTGVNDSDATLTDSYGLLLQKEAHSATDNITLFVKSAPAAPYAIIARVEICAPCSGRTTSPQIGLCFRNSGDGKFYHFSVSLSSVISGDNAPWIWAGKYDSPTSLSAALVGPCPLFVIGQLWLRIEDDNTDLKFAVSSDGLHFVEFASEARATFSTPDQVGISTQNYNNTTEDFTIAARVTHWSES